MKQIAPNTVLQGRYVVGSLIGKGGMGEVYLGKDQRLGNNVALKRTFFTDDELLSGAFEREAKMLANLRHNVLPKVIDHFTENEEQFLVMEYIGGEDLSQRLKTTKAAFPVNWVLFWADELLDSLAYLHAHNPPIVHRDIKPQNLKLTKDNHIILLDFGLAKNTTGKTRVSTAASLIGYTPHYAPIEQIRGTGTNSRSDLFSLAATLYHLMTNTTPSEALSRADVILGGKPDPLKPPHELNPDISPLISNVIIKAMSLNQEQRFSSAREMQKALRDAYTQMQQLSNAQTVAFNLAEQNVNQIQEQSAFDSNSQKTEEFNLSPANFEKTEVMEFPIPPKQDFEATIPMGSFPTPLEDKTEVFTEVSKQEDKTEAFAFVDKKEDKVDTFTDSNNQPSEIDFAQTMPVISLEENQANKTPASPFDETDSFQIIEPTPESFSEPKEEVYAASAAVASPQKKSSNGKLVGILVGLFAVGLLAVSGVLGGLYYYQNYTEAPKPTPTPEVKKTVEPTPEVTPTPTVENTNTSNSNVSTNSGTNSVTPKETPTPASTPTKVDVTPTPNVDRPNQPTPQPTVAKTPITQATPKPQPTSKPVVTPKPATPKPTVKPVGGRKDDIEQ
ncbi:MAG: protein kinase [Pyrinomonadaceae bacterium]|nr:protein kinase [Pyrinomonadaceae bacterium]